MYLKCAFLLLGFVAFAVASPVNYFADIDEYQHPAETTLVRHVRSPGGGSLDIGYSDDQFGRTASVQYNQNLYRSNDDRFTVDAYAQASRNFDFNRNDYGGGITGSYHFG